MPYAIIAVQLLHTVSNDESEYHTPNSELSHHQFGTNKYVTLSNTIKHVSAFKIKQLYCSE